MKKRTSNMLFLLYQCCLLFCLSLGKKEEVYEKLAEVPLPSNKGSILKEIYFHWSCSGSSEYKASKLLTDIFLLCISCIINF